ncbi:MAG: esterase, partial [Paenibacillus sp.]|nr:esterase [Paenibacillus sp.]
MERFHVFTVGERQLHLYLPPAYKSSPEARFPVVYVQDSGELFQRCLNELEHHFRQGKLPELIFVGIKPFDRNNDYTPWPADELLASKPPFGGNGRAYVDELADVIKPYIDANYRTKPEAEHTAIVGGSLGALIAMFAGYWRPEVFGRLGLLSASFWYEGVLDYVIGQPAPAEHIRMYMSVGDCEGIYKTNAQRNMFPYTKQAHAALLAKDGDDRRLRFEVTEGGTHDFHHMGLRLSDALAWLFAPDGGGEREKRAAEGDAPAIIERPYTIPGTREWTMHARRTGKEYRINVYIP